MTAYLKPSFSVMEGPSDVSDGERRANWGKTFGNNCAICDKLGWAQTPMRHVKCSVQGCGQSYCPEHKTEHMQRFHNPQYQPTENDNG
jgi:hypothetical protein